MKSALYQIADELRAVANLGLLYTEVDYDRERYQKILTASANILALLEDLSYDEVLELYLQNLTHVSPLIGAGVVIFHDEKILLIKRHDDGRWAIPGGLVEVGETAAETAKRELFEEVGIQADIVKLLGVFDSRIWKSNTGMQLYHLVFLAETDDIFPRTSKEALDVGYFCEDELPPLSSGHHLRVPFYFKQIRGETPIPYFDLRSS